MIWFNKHLNWTWVLACALQFTTIGFETPIPYLITHIFFLGITLWVIHRKGRCWLWILIPISAPCLSNERNNSKGGDLNED